jgi:RNA polymerase sigma-70 factor (ECF subfamily)
MLSVLATLTALLVVTDLARAADAISLVALTDDGTLLRFSSTAPATVTSVALSGTSGRLLGLDRRPADGLIYAISDASEIYRVDPRTGTATLVSRLTAPFDGDQRSGVDFLPHLDRLRLLSHDGQNVRVHVGLGASAVDLTQEVFVTFSAKPAAFDPTRGALGALLATMARTRAIDRVRFRTRSVRLLRRHHESEPPPPGPPTPADAMSVGERTERVRAALAELSGDERRVLELAYWSGLTQAEIADELDTPLGTVKSWMRRGLLRMRGTLGDLVE